MRKLLVLVFASILLVGCNSTKKYEEIMREYAVDFYESHKRGQENLESITVSIKQLKEAVEVIHDDYDMSKLEKCSDDSYVELILNNSKEVTEVKYYLECK